MDNLQEIIKRNNDELRAKDKIDTCDYSLLHKENRLWCDKRERTLIRAYCNICPEYKNEELGIKPLYIILKSLLK